MNNGANRGEKNGIGGAAARSACAEGQSIDGASVASALGSTQSYCFTTEAEGGVDSRERRRVRWSARAMLWQASSLKAVRCCGRMLHNDGVRDPDDGQSVLIRRREVDGRMVASYQGLMTCGSVWSCPRCSAVVAHTRATEIGAAVRECYRQGGKVYMLTLTMRHSASDRLADLWDALSSGWRSAFGTRAWTGQSARLEERNGKSVGIKARSGDVELFEVAGLTRVVEATFGTPAQGGRGWHLHIHALVFCSSTLRAGLRSELPDWISPQQDREWLARNAFASRVHGRWSIGLEKAGYKLPGAVAVDVREVGDGGTEYLGRYLTKATYDAATKTGIEVAAGQVSKVGRLERNRTPFELLADLAESVDARGFGVRTPRHWAVKEAGDGDWAVIDRDTGEVLAVTPPGEWAIWHEWEQASKGRRQIMWSRRRRDPASAREELWNRLLDVRGATADESDEEVAAADVDGDVVGEVSRADWYGVVVWRPELVTALLEAAEAEGRAGVAKLLAEIAVIAALGHPPPYEGVAA